MQAIEKVGLHFKKKSMIAKEQKRDDIVKRRLNFTLASRFVDPHSFVFLDESSAKTNMTRLYGRSPIGERCRFYNTHGHWQTTTMISAIRMDGVIEKATLLLDGPMTSDVFARYVENMLSPVLRPGDIVVMDNLSAHKSVVIEELIDNANAGLWYLPAYSPDLNPIEKMWSKVKSYFRRLSASTVEGLVKAAGQAFRAVTAAECRNYFASCGYGI